MHRSQAGASQKVTKERVTLNPEREKRDSEYCEKVLGNEALKDTLEAVWYCALGSGDALRNERCDFPHYRKAFSPPLSSFVENERQLSMLYRAFDTQHTGEDVIDFIGFVRSLFHLGMDRFETSDYTVALDSMVATYLKPFLVNCRKANDWSTSTPDTTLLEDPDIDAILYVYDGVFDRLFHRYRSVDDHENRDLTLEQSTLLDQFVETLELREFAKDYGFFPRHLAWVEISAAAQISCFGCIVRDPGSMGPAYQSSVESVDALTIKTMRAAVINKPIEEKDAAAADGDAPAAASTSDAGSPLTSSAYSVRRNVKNPLFVEALPEEFLRDEALLDRNRFMTALLRIAQALYNRPEFLKRLPSGASRVEEMLAHMAPLYERSFGRTMDSDCDHSDRGVPVLLSSSPTAALDPCRIPMAGDVDVTILGNNFGEKRGVYARFGPKGNAVLVRCREVSKRKVIVRAPPAIPQDISVGLSFSRGQYTIRISRTAQLVVECSNNRVDFSNSDPPQLLSYEEPLPPHSVTETLTPRLLRSFAVLCAYGQPYNSKYLTVDNWRRAKQLFSIREGDEAATTDPIPPTSPTPPPPDDTEAHGSDNRDVFFLLHAQMHEGAPGLSLDFKSYLSTLARCFYSSYGAHTWMVHFERIAGVEVSHTKVVRRGSTVHSEVVDENSACDNAIDAVEHRTVRELDVYLGAVLCGFIKEQPGHLVSDATGLPVVHFKNHGALSYRHYDDFGSEKIALGVIMASVNFSGAVDRLLQAGFDLAAHDSDRSTRKPVGRCWAIANGKERVGTMWDYPGQLSPMLWQPAVQSLTHPQLTIGIYRMPHSEDFRKVFQIFTKANLRGPGDARDLLAAKGFSVTTKLYRIPG